MRYGLTIPNFGEFADARLLATMAREAEEVGWDGFFIWDHVQFMPTAHVDPWVALTAIALGARGRHRSWTLGMGLFGRRDGSTHPRRHARRSARSPTPLLPRPRQTPRIPIWVAGTWPAKPPFRRAARWDGVVPLGPDRGVGPRMPPADIREMLAYVQKHRVSNAAFDVVIGGETTGTDRHRDVATVEPYISAGATWWVEDISPWAFGWKWTGPWPLDRMRDRVRNGPPRA
jgi:alkanesulfonate monooxygenase SsuD/methylene tetrahydromethanopterin reductase-like flavin-dependent oxidoreductase (luciferase family)